MPKNRTAPTVTEHPSPPTAQRWNPDEPPSATAYGGASPEAVATVNAAVLAEHESAAAQAMQAPFAGKVEAAREAERARARAQHAAEQAAQARGGGSAVTATLRGELGEHIGYQVRLDKIEATARRLRSRLAVERAEAEHRSREQAEADELARLVGEAWTEAERKRAVPPITAPWDSYTRARPTLRPEWAEAQALAVVRELAARSARSAVCSALDGADEFVRWEAALVLADAARVAEQITSAGLPLDADPAEVLGACSARPELAAAWSAWTAAVSAWTEVQSARRWLAQAAVRGFHVGTGTGAGSAAGSLALSGVGERDTAAACWSAQFAGPLPAGLADPAAVLAWWCSLPADRRPAAAGVLGVAGVAEAVAESGEQAEQAAADEHESEATSG